MYRYRDMHGVGVPWFGLVMMLGFIVLVVLGVVLLVRLLRTPATGGPDVLMRAPVPPHPGFPPGPPAAPAAPIADPALHEVRMRYARGELSRDEFVRLSTDLGGPVAPPAASAPPAAGQ